MTPMQHMLLGVGASKKTYMDDVFSNYLYKGTGASRTINNGTNLSGEGGMVWLKGRDTAVSHVLFDTERGATKMLIANDTYDTLTISNSLTSFNSNGFTLGDYSSANGSGNDYSSWTFRKAKGFFDIVTYTGSSSARTIAHSLGCVPGAIFIKKTSSNDYWAVYHEGLDSSSPEDYYSKLNENSARIDDANFWNDTKPTASVFSLGAAGAVNSDGNTYVAYLFAGGESTAATARSVKFDGTNDYMTIPTHADLAMGTGDFTLEGWVKVNEIDVLKFIYDGRDNTSSTRMAIWVDDTNKIRAYFDNTSRDSRTVVKKGQWYHFAVTRSGTTSRLFINGIQELSWSDSVDYAAPASNSYIGGIPGGSYTVDGSVSNFRIVKGTAVYTSSFRPPTEPLTNVTNTKLLCCNNSSVTGSTVSPTTIANSGSTASTDSPFDDPAGFVFGENEDQNVIKCGSFVGNGSATGPEINLGWEPQYILLKNTNATENWHLFDSMRGIVTGANDTKLQPNTSDAENSAIQRLNLTPTGFKITDANADCNGNGNTIIYMAIRRPDGYCGKLAKLGTDVFAMDTGDGVAGIPDYDSNFPVDFALARKPASGWNNEAHARLIGAKYLVTDGDNVEVSASQITWDSNVGWHNSGSNSDYQSWMWKRHAGFDVMTYTGNATARALPHSLNKIPEMIWVKDRNRDNDWVVYHKGLNSGSNPEDKYLLLNEADAEADSTGMWNDTAPTSTHFTIGSHGYVNEAPGGNGDKFIAMLFSSVSGISKVGYYTGSASGNTVTLGFQPRFVIIKTANSGGAYMDWAVLDTTRGWGSGNDQRLHLNSVAAQNSQDWGAPTSTGFTVSSGYHNNSDNVIYYAHA